MRDAAFIPERVRMITLDDVHRIREHYFIANRPAPQFLVLTPQQYDSLMRELGPMRGPVDHIMGMEILVPYEARQGARPPRPIEGARLTDLTIDDIRPARGGTTLLDAMRYAGGLTRGHAERAFEAAVDILGQPIEPPAPNVHSNWPG